MMYEVVRFSLRDPLPETSHRGIFNEVQVEWLREKYHNQIWAFPIVEELEADGDLTVYCTSVEEIQNA